MVRFERPLVIAKDELNVNFLLPCIPVTFVLIAKVINAFNDIFVSSPPSTCNLLSDVPLVFWLRHRGAVSVHIIIGSKGGIQDTVLYRKGVLLLSIILLCVVGSVIGDVIIIAIERALVIRIIFVRIVIEFVIGSNLVICGAG